MVDLVVPVTAPGASAATNEVRGFAGAAAAVTKENERLQASSVRVGAAFRGKSQAVAVAGRSFGATAKQAGLLGAKLSTLAVLTGGVGGKFAALGGLAGTLGPLGLVIGGITVAMGLMGDRAEAAADRIKKIGELKDKIGGLGKDRNALIDEMASTTEKAGQTPGLREAIVAGVSGKRIQSTQNAQTSPEQAALIETALANSGLGPSQVEEIRKTSAMAAKLSGDRVGAVTSLIEQATSSNQRIGNQGSGVLAPMVERRGVSTPMDAILDAAGFDPGSEQGQRAGRNLQSAQLNILDQSQSGRVQREQETIGNAFSTKGLDAIIDVQSRYVPVMEKNTKEVSTLDATIKDLTTELKKMQRESSRKTTVLFGATEY